MTEQETLDHASAEAPPYAVLVASAHPGSSEVCDILRGCGFLVVLVETWTEALAEITSGSVDLGIVDGSLASLPSLLPHHATPDLMRDEGGAPSVPLIFSVADPDQFDWVTYRRLNQADYVVAPLSAVELARRAEILAAKLRRHRRQQASATLLRSGVRDISASVRATNSSTTIIENYLDGVGHVFDLRRASFLTFGDPRIAHLSLEFCRDAPSIGPCPVAPHERSLQRLTTHLWEAGTTLAFDGRTEPPFPAGAEGLRPWALERAGRNCLLVPLGAGETPFGLLWMSSDEDRRTWSSIEVSLLRHLAGNVAHELMQSQVIAQQETFRRAQRLDRAKNDFLTTMNHELRTPLTSLTAYLELVQDGMGGAIPRPAMDMLDVAARNANRLGLLFEDVVTISRMTANDPQVDWRPLDLTGLLSGVVDASGPAAGAQQVSLSLDAPADLVVEGDAAQLQQVFANITDNAVKFTPPGGRVELSVQQHTERPQPGMVTVVVTDTGVGIDEDDLPDIFQGFFRGSNAQAAATPGTGLGLAIVQGLVDAHGGTVTATSTVGRGTSVTVQLPVANPYASPPA